VPPYLLAVVEEAWENSWTACPFARHETELDRIVGHAEYDGNGRGRGLGHHCRGG
jgi:hypothetical protein